MSHIPSSNDPRRKIYMHTTERTSEDIIQDIDCEYGCMPMDHGAGVEEQQEAAMRYIQDTYGVGGIYDKMVHRNQDGSDPLVQEPKQ